MKTIEQLAEERYPYSKRQFSSSWFDNDKGIDEKREGYIAGYTEDKWIRVEDRPLVTREEKEWVCTDDGSKPFIAALQYNDSTQPGKELWWIHHCVIEDQVGLCIVGEDENTPAGWQIEDVTHWQKLPSPPKTDL